MKYEGVASRKGKNKFCYYHVLSIKNSTTSNFISKTCKHIAMCLQVFFPNDSSGPQPMWPKWQRWKRSGR